jgi:hypothetical protein
MSLHFLLLIPTVSSASSGPFLTFKKVNLSPTCQIAFQHASLLLSFVAGCLFQQVVDDGVIGSILPFEAFRS